MADSKIIKIIRFIHVYIMTKYEKKYHIENIALHINFIFLKPHIKETPQVVSFRCLRAL